MKKWLCLALSLLMLAIGLSALAESEEWNFDDAYFVLKGYNGAGGDVVVPGNIREGSVDSIDGSVFNGSQTITSLTLPETVLELRTDVAGWCPNLASISLPESLISIGDQCFYNCDALTEVTIPAGVRFIGLRVFSDCDSLSKVTFEGVCPVICEDSFAWISDDAVIYVPDDQLEAYQSAFEALDVSASVQPSGQNAVIVDNNGFVEEEFDFDASTGTITCYYGYATYLRIPETIGGVPVKAIGAEAFQGSNYLAVLELPEGLETIEENAFAFCQALNHVSFPSTLKTIGAKAFGGGCRLHSLDLTGVETIGDQAFQQCLITGELSLPETLVSIGSEAFDMNTNITELYLPASLQTIGDNAFADDWSLEYVYMDGLMPPAMGENVFAGSSYLADIDMNEHCTKQQMLDLQAYVDAQGLSCRVWRIQNTLTSYPTDDLSTYEGNLMTGYSGEMTHIRPYDVCEDITITGIADGALAGNTVVEYFAVCHSDEFTTIGAEAFRDSALRGVDLFDSVTTIGARAFANCVYLEELTIPESVTEIGEDAFAGLSGLKKVTILCDASIIPAGSFAGCSALTEAYVASGEIPSSLFEGSALTSVELGDGVTAIGERAFASTQLTCADLSHVTSIGASAFEAAPLTSATLGGASIGERAFASTQLTSADLSHVTSIGASAFEAVPLTSVTLGGTSIGERAFANTQLTSADLSQVASIGASAFEAVPLTSVTLGGASIGERAFANTQLTYADLSQVTGIGASAFEAAPLTSVTLGGASIGERAFANTQLTYADLSQVTGIGVSAFEAVPLTSVTLNSSALVGERAFADTQLAQIAIPAFGDFPLSAIEGTNAEIRLSADATDEQIAAWSEKLGRPWYNPVVREGEPIAFVTMPFKPTPAENFEFDPTTGRIIAYTGSDVDVVVPREIDGVTVVGFENYNAFESCRDYTNSSVENNVTEWVHLRTLVLPETIQELPDSMLSYCQQLETFICYAPLERTGATQFMLCRSLNNVIFVNGVREISSYAFDSDGPLNNLYFGKHLDKICGQAFNYSALTSFVADATEIESGAFTACENLTSLHLTSKVKTLGMTFVNDCTSLSEICFDGCDLTGMSESLLCRVAPQLTVHVSPDANEETLNRAQKCVSWSDIQTETTVTTEPCAHVVSDVPDALALVPGLALADGSSTPAAPAVTSEPAATSEPEPAPQPDAQPASGIPAEYVGTWYGVTMIMEGQEFALADMGMSMVITIAEDGAVQMEMDGETESTFAQMQNGVLVVDSMAGTIEDGQLAFGDDEATIILSREKPEMPEVTAAPVDESATLDTFLGVWTATSITTEGMTLPADIAGMAGDTLVIYGDTCDLTLTGMLLDNLSCHMDGSRLVFTVLESDCVVTLRTDGTIAFDMDDATVWYERTGDAPEKPVEAPIEATPTEAPAEVPTEAPVETPVPETGLFDPIAMAEIKFVMTDADVDGYNMTTVMMGGLEYAFVFHADGTVDFVMAGTAIPALKWTLGIVPTEDGETDGVIIDYFGQPLNITPTETGFDLNYFDAMLMHFAPEEPEQ